MFNVKFFLLVVFGLTVVYAEYCQERYGKEGEGEEEESEDKSGWAIGIILCIASACASVLGLTCQKKAHMKNEHLPIEKRKPYIKIPIWWCGLGGIILGAILDFLSLGFAPQTVVASLGSTTLVINALVAPLILKEKLSRLEIVGTLTITIGAAIAVSSSSQKAQSYNLDILKCLYRESGFIIYAVVISAFALTLYTLFKIADKKAESDDISYYPYWAKIHPFTVTTLSGTLGAQSLLFAKSFSIILRGIYSPSADSDGASVFLHYETYLIIVAMICTIISQTHTLNLSLQRFDSVVVLPLFQVFWITMGVFGAGAYFKEFNDVTVSSILIFVLGILIVTCGIAILASRPVMTEFEAELEGIQARVDDPDDEIEIEAPVGPVFDPTRRRSTFVPFLSAGILVSAPFIEVPAQTDPNLEARRASRARLEGKYEATRRTAEARLTAENNMVSLPITRKSLKPSSIIAPTLPHHARITDST
eukprot:c21185_g1_i1.p1 GENE.c21185_g1_i1~~c21185_g1_i1.p1  ORF type:complete len:486 (+),score=198.18 c21185_g1_i1:25-1458(+)